MQAAKGREGHGGTTAWLVFGALVCCGTSADCCWLPATSLCHAPYASMLSLHDRAAAAFFYGKDGPVQVAYISDAYRLLSPAVGTVAAKVIFGIALLASGQNSTITGTLSGEPKMLLLQSLADGCLKCNPSWKQLVKAALDCWVCFRSFS